MKIVVIFILMCISNLLNAQELESHSLLKKEIQVMSENHKTNILISDTDIIVKKYLDKNTKDLIRKIERVESKPYNGTNCIWYYCVSLEKDIFINDYRKSIFIYDEKSKSIVFADFTSEVDVIWKKFLFENFM